MRVLGFFLLVLGTASLILGATNYFEEVKFVMSVIGVAGSLVLGWELLRE